MSEEKIRNFKSAASETVGPDNIPSFLLKTYQILENPKYSDIVCWTKSGEGFVVKKVKEFAENILPIHFRHSNYTSFVRQLNMYDFHKIRQQNQQNAFKNSMFKRGQKHLLKEIERKDYKKKKEKPSTTEKSNPIPHQVQIKTNTMKKLEHEKEFYMKGLSVLTKIDEEMSSKQEELANVNENTMRFSDESLSNLLELIFKVKSLNNSWYGRLASLSKQWQNILTLRKNTLKKEVEATRDIENNKKYLQPTMPSLQSFTHYA